MRVCVFNAFMYMAVCTPRTAKHVYPYMAQFQTDDPV